jgi:hypothetical protein
MAAIMTAWRNGESYQRGSFEMKERRKRMAAINMAKIMASMA